MVTLAVVGDRVESYETHRGIDRVLASLPPDVRAGWHATDRLDLDELAGADAVWIAPGSPYRDREAVLAAIRQARERDQPLLATCGGFQHLVLEFARNVAGIAGAESEEEHPAAPDLVVARLACSLVGRVRAVTARAGTRAAEICGLEPFDGFHYCNFGLAPGSVAPLAAAGLVVSGDAPDAGVEIVELPAHRFYFGTLFQPQMSPTDDGEHPILQAFLASARAP
jgi:CTP synthase (UTP-ammonia lyase)